MNRRLLSVFAFALAVALIASLLVYRLLVSSLGRSPATLSTRMVAVASRDLEVGVLINPDDIHLVSCNDCPVLQTFANLQDVAGRGVVATIFKDEPILAPRLAARGAGAGLASTIPLGKRAVALRVNDVVGLAGFVLPGMKVDVIVSSSGSSVPSLRDRTITRTVLQNIEVLSAGQIIEHKMDGKPEDVQVVNLLVTPEQAETLTLASNETKVQLVLRNPLDTAEQKTKGTSIEALLLGADYRPPVPQQAVVAFAVRPPLAAPAPKPAPSTTVEVISGITKHEQTFETH